MDISQDSIPVMWMEKDFRRCWNILLNLKLDTVPEKVFKLSEVPEAHRYLESSGSFGKTVVVIE